MMRSLALVALLATTALARPALAVEDPRAGRWDARVRTVAYNPMNPVRLVGSTFTSTQIIFAVGETVTHVAIGNSEAWLAQPTGNLLFIKPIEVRAPTNMQVVTSRPDGSIRSYQFELVARAAPSPTSWAGREPGRNGSRGRRAGDAVRDPVHLSRGCTPGRHGGSATAARGGASEREAQSRLAVDFFSGPRNWRYAAQGSHAIEPAEVSDNGRLTAFRFPGNMTVPTIYTVALDGQETIVPYNMRGDRAVVSTTAKEFRLRYGGEVLRVFNLAFDPIGSNPGTGTTTPDVVRSVREVRQ